MATIVRFADYQRSATSSSAGNVALDLADGDTHDHCPRCGAANGPFERLGSGVCAACLSKPRQLHKYKRPQIRQNARPGQSHAQTNGARSGRRPH